MAEKRLLQPLHRSSKQPGGQVVPRDQYFLDNEQISYTKHVWLVS